MKPVIWALRCSKPEPETASSCHYLKLQCHISHCKSSHWFKLSEQMCLKYQNFWAYVLVWKLIILYNYSQQHLISSIKPQPRANKFITLKDSVLPHRRPKIIEDYTMHLQERKSQCWKIISNVISHKEYELLNECKQHLFKDNSLFNMSNG